eukprot:TRINITY_DN5876_c0_g1_i1.p1 TRINITY_DN5876_c0_g1~~TRINITY_DN5876_c0_g1_i1.p1  ORF type:complete len:290 (+),score=95.34 TRINITY_DN5876_c0_g1_i1:47-871(+)
MPGYSAGGRRASRQERQLEQFRAASRGQRLRGPSFKDEYSRAVRRSGFATGDVAKLPSMVSEPAKAMLPPQLPSDVGRVTVVLDLDETCVYAREGPLYARPGLAELLDFLGQNAEPVVWTAGVRSYAQAVVRNIDRRGIFRHCVYRHKKWFSGCAGYNKDLTLLGRNMDKLLILENTPDCVRGNEQNAIVVSDYEGAPGQAGDPTLFAIKELLQDMCEQVEKYDVTVPQYITSTPLLTQMSIPTDIGDRISVYCLDCRNFGASKEGRVNRDIRQ